MNELIAYGFLPFTDMVGAMQPFQTNEFVTRASVSRFEAGHAK